MKIIVKNGKVVQMSASGDIRQQLADIGAVARALRRYAKEMRMASDTILNQDFGLDELTREKTSSRRSESCLFDFGEAATTEEPKQEAKPKEPATGSRSSKSATKGGGKA